MSYTGLVQPTAMTSLAEVIDDTTPLINKVYSSDKVQSDVNSLQENKLDEVGGSLDQLTASPNSQPIKDALNAGGDAPIYACRAWVNFNGTGTVAIRASGNVSSITDTGTGMYKVNFAIAMPDTSYTCFTQVIETGTSNEISTPSIEVGWLTSSIDVFSIKSGIGVYDAQIMSVSIFR